jgi:hypothetical protein
MPGAAQCVISGTVYGPGGAPAPNTVLIFSVPQQVISGAIIDQDVISAKTDANGNLAGVALPQRAVLTFTIGNGYPVNGVVPSTASANLNQLISGTVFDGGSFQVNGVNLQNQSVISFNDGFGVQMVNPSGGIVRGDLKPEGFEINGAPIKEVPVDFVNGAGIAVTNAIQGQIQHDLALQGFIEGNGITITMPSPGQVRFDVEAIPQGTVMLFRQVAVPVGWTRIVDPFYNDKMIRVVTGGIVDGGSWVITGLTSQGHLHGLGGHTHFIQAHQHDLQNHTHAGGAHTHAVTFTDNHNIAGGGAIGVVGDDLAVVTNTFPPSDGPIPNVTGDFGQTSDGPNTTSDVAGALGIISDGQWRPAQIDVIMGQFNG